MIRLIDLRRRCRRFLRDQRATTMVEFGLTFPVTVLLMLGLMDFGRMFHHVITLKGAAAAGAYYGSLDNEIGYETTETASASADAASELNYAGTIDSESVYFCDCPDAPATGPSDPNAISCTTSDCGSYGAVRMYVRTSTSQVFKPFSEISGLTRPMTLRGSVTMRVQ